MYKPLKISLLFFKEYQVGSARHLEVLTEHYLQNELITLCSMLLLDRDWNTLHRSSQDVKNTSLTMVYLQTTTPNTRILRKEALNAAF